MQNSTLVRLRRRCGKLVSDTIHPSPSGGSATHKRHHLSINVGTMPTIVRDNGFSFVIYPNDHHPPHVHVKMRDGRQCRIDLLSGEFMDTPPAGMARSIRNSYFNNVADIWAAWERYHADED